VIRIEKGFGLLRLLLSSLIRSPIRFFYFRSEFFSHPPTAEFLITMPFLTDEIPADEAMPFLTDEIPADGT
jgi:hypothetical protein